MTCSKQQARLPWCREKGGRESRYQGSQVTMLAVQCKRYGSELGDGEKDQSSFGEWGQQQACEECSVREDPEMMQGLETLPGAS